MFLVIFSGLRNRCRRLTDCTPLSPVLGGEGLGGEGEGLCKGKIPLTPYPSPPEYRGRGESGYYFFGKPR